MREHHARTDDDALESLELISDSKVDIKGDSKFVSNLEETRKVIRENLRGSRFILSQHHRTVLTE